MITEESAAILMKDGTVAICAWCEHLHEARAKNMPNCGMIGCGGPAALKSFPKYKGPMEGNLAGICYMCGQEADFGAMLGGRMIGVCNRIIPGNEKTGLTCSGLFHKILESRRAKITEEQAAIIK